MKIELEAIIAALWWLPVSYYTGDTILSDSPAMHQGSVIGEMVNLSYIGMSSLHYLRLICCPDNEKADVLISRAPIVGTVRMDKGHNVHHLRQVAAGWHSCGWVSPATTLTFSITYASSKLNPTGTESFIVSTLALPTSTKEDLTHLCVLILIPVNNCWAYFEY